MNILNLAQNMIQAAYLLSSLLVTCETRGSFFNYNSQEVYRTELKDELDLELCLVTYFLDY